MRRSNLDDSPGIRQSDVEEPSNRHIGKKVTDKTAQKYAYVIVLHAKTTTQPYPPSGISSTGA